MNKCSYCGMVSKCAFCGAYPTNQIATPQKWQAEAAELLEFILCLADYAGGESIREEKAKARALLSDLQHTGPR